MVSRISQCMEAQLLLHGYLFQWQEISLAQPSQTLIALRNLLCGAAGDAQEDSRGTTKENLDPCMFARPQGYEVQMSWSTLTVATTATKSLAQALSWRASLTAMRHEAQRRLHRTAEGKAPRVPLLDSELKALLVMQPDIRLMFRYQVPAKKIEGERIPCRLTLFTPRLELASQMRDEMSAVTSKRKLDEVVASYKNTVAWEKKKAKQYFDKVLQEINKTWNDELNIWDQLQKSSARGVPGSEVSQIFCATLGLESSAQIKSAIANLQQVPIPERSRRVKALLAKAKALPAPPAVLPVAPPPTARRSSARGRTWTGGLLPRETMATIVSGLPFFDLAQCRPASKGMLSVSHDCYWQRCRNMSLPLDPTVLGGFRRNRAGRIYYKTDALTVTLRFVAQPKVISTVERLNLENMTGKDVGERLFGCLNQIKHLQFESEIAATLEYPASIIGALIGSRGAKINEVRTASGAKIQVKKHEEMCKVLIAGSDEQVASARELVEFLADEARQITELPKTGEEDERLEFPIAVCGRIIGSKGHQISEVRSKSGAQVKIEKLEEVCRVYLGGKPDQVETAKKMINSLVEDKHPPPARRTDRPHEIRLAEAEETVDIPFSMVGRVCLAMLMQPIITSGHDASMFIG
eukprot:s2133_g1.t1